MPIGATSLIDTLTVYGIGTDHVVWFIVGVVFLFVGIYSLLLLYHWTRYGLASFPMWTALLVYFSILGILLITLTTSAFSIVAS